MSDVIQQVEEKSDILNKSFYKLVLGVVLFILIVIATIIFFAYSKRTKLMRAACTAAVFQPELLPPLKLAGIC